MADEHVERIRYAVRVRRTCILPRSEPLARWRLVLGASTEPALDPAFQTFWHTTFLMKNSVHLMVADFAPKDRIGIDSRIRLERRWRPSVLRVEPPWAALATP